jgi:hypothetical protein|tara:strand:- start:4566 stop:5189 length:624 start_codon:yes stop_codon:yes gene_type:complete
MSQFERRLDPLNKKQIIYKRNPTSDKPDSETKDYWYYKEGTYQCYSLFQSKAKITSYKSLKWHLLVIWYLNPQLTEEMFRLVAKDITTLENGFVSFKIPYNTLQNICYDVSMCDLDKPPVNKSRKVIFKWNTLLDKSEKLRIVGKLIGRTKKIESDDVYEMMIQLHHDNKKITIQRISELLNVTTRTVHRRMCYELKKEKELLNQQL